MKAISLGLVLMLLGARGTTYESFPTATSPDQTYIQQVIADFSRTRRLLRQDSVFEVVIADTVRHCGVLKAVKEHPAHWVAGPPIEGLLAVSILATRTRFLFTSTTRAGFQEKLPSRYLEKDGRLYYWWDKRYPLTEEALAVFWKYHLFQDDEGGRRVFADNTRDDAKKGATYYFCRRDPTTYKRVFSAIATGYYEPPTIRCSQ